MMSEKVVFNRYFKELTAVARQGDAGEGSFYPVLAEMLTGSGGLGAIIIDLQRLFRVADMYAWIVILAVTGLALVMGFEALERRLVFWLGRG